MTGLRYIGSHIYNEYCRTLKLVITTLAIVCIDTLTVADMVNHTINVVIHMNILLTGQGCGRFH